MLGIACIQRLIINIWRLLIPRMDIIFATVNFKIVLVLSDYLLLLWLMILLSLNLRSLVFAIDNLSWRLILLNLRLRCLMLAIENLCLRMILLNMRLGSLMFAIKSMCWSGLGRRRIKFMFSNILMGVEHIMVWFAFWWLMSWSNLFFELLGLDFVLKTLKLLLLLHYLVFTLLDLL